MKKLLGRTIPAPKASAANPGAYEPKTLAAMLKQNTPAPLNTAQTGRIILVQLVGQLSPTQQLSIVPYVIPAGNANAFEIVSSPVALRVRSDIFTDTLYSAQMGDAFQGKLGALTISGIGCNLANNANTFINLPATASGQVFLKVKVWIGTKTSLGLTDKRIFPASTYRERMQIATPATGTLGTILNNVAAAAAVTNFTVNSLSQPSQVYSQFQVVREWLITNLDTANTIYVTDGFNTANPGNGLVAVFPQSSIRIPVKSEFVVTVDPNDNFTLAEIGIYNPAATGVQCMVTGIIGYAACEFDSE